MNFLPLIFGAILLAAGELARAYHIGGLAGLAIFSLPAAPLYLLLARNLQDKWERFLIASSLYLSLAGLALFILRLIFFVPLNFDNLFLVAEALGISFSALLPFAKFELRARISFGRASLPLFALLLFAALFYSSAATTQDSWEKELRQVKWATGVFQSNEGGVRADVLQFMAHSPFHVVLGTITSNLFGFSQASKGFLHAIFAVSEVLLLVLLSKSMFKDSKPGFVAAAFLISSGLFLHFTSTADYDAPRIYFDLLTFYALYRYLETDNKLFFYLLPLFFSLSVYTKMESVIYLAPICAFLFLRKVTFSMKDITPNNFQFKRLAIFLILTGMLGLPLISSLLEADKVSNGQYGPLWRMRIASVSFKPKDVLSIDRIMSIFPGTVWGFRAPNALNPSEYLPLLFSNGGVTADGKKAILAGGDNIAGSFYENPPLYAVFILSFAYFGYRKFREHSLFITYTGFSFLFMFLFYIGVDWLQFTTIWILGMLALGYLFVEQTGKLKNGSMVNALLLAILCVALMSSFIYTANTVFHFDYYSGVNFYRDSLFMGDPVFGAFAAGKYIREHTTSADTYLADTCYLSEVVTNRNAWTGAAPPRYTVLPTESFPNSRAQHEALQKQMGYTELLSGRPPTAVLTYGGFPYLELYRINLNTKYLDEGVCIEAAEYGKDYKNWGLFFSGPSGIC